MKFDKTQLEREYEQYQEKVSSDLRKFGKEGDVYQTRDEIPVKVLYTPIDTEDIDYMQERGFPGEFPFTRGAFSAGNRGRPWTRRQLQSYGFTMPEFKELLLREIDKGATGLWLMYSPPYGGVDPDDPLKLGYNFYTCAEMVAYSQFQEILKAVDDKKGLDKINFNINNSNEAGFAMFIAAYESLGYDRKDIVGTIQNYVRRRLYPESRGNPSVDIVEFCYNEVPRFNAIFTNPRSMSDAGSTAAQEIAYAISCLIESIDACMERGMLPDKLGRRIVCAVGTQLNLFEQVAKMRALRQMWATTMRERYKSTDEAAQCLRFAISNDGSPMQANRPLLNIARATIMTLAGILGGAQAISLVTFDEALGTPSEGACHLSLGIQEVLAHEVRAGDVIDPLGGSYYVESLTEELKNKAQGYIGEILKRGGIAKEGGDWFLKQVEQASWELEQKIARKETIIVGNNAFTEQDKGLEAEKFAALLPEWDSAAVEKGLAEIRKIKEARDKDAVEKAKEQIYNVYRSGENVIPILVETAKSDITMGEIASIRASALGSDRYGSVCRDTVESALFFLR